MVQIKLFLLASVFEIVCKAFDFNVGLCRKDILDQRYKEFKIETIANTGSYDYIYLNANPYLLSGSSAIYGDEEMGYRGSAKLTLDGYVIKHMYYYLNVLDGGLLNETHVGIDKNNQIVVENYILVVLNYEPEKGVFYYVRCSKRGKCDTDHRFISVRCSNSFSGSDARFLARDWYKEDRLKRFRGDPMRSISTCKFDPST